MSVSSHYGKDSNNWDANRHLVSRRSYASRRSRCNGIECRTWSDSSFWSSLIWVCTVCSDLLVPIFRILLVVLIYTTSTAVSLAPPSHMSVSKTVYVLKLQHKYVYHWLLYVSIFSQSLEIRSPIRTCFCFHWRIFGRRSNHPKKSRSATNLHPTYTYILFLFFFFALKFFLHMAITFFNGI